MALADYLKLFFSFGSSKKSKIHEDESHFNNGNLDENYINTDEGNE